MNNIILKCYDKCGSSCYGIKNNQCSCATKGFYDYILKTEDLIYECKKLPYFDFKRYNSVIFTLSEPKKYIGFDFWFYLTQGARNYNLQRLLFQISTKNDNLDLVKIERNSIQCRDLLYGGNSNDRLIFNMWIHVDCFSQNMKIFSIDNSVIYSGTTSSDCGNPECKKIEFINGENALTSPEIILVRQFKSWSDITKKKKKYIIFNLIIM